MKRQRTRFQPRDSKGKAHPVLRTIDRASNPWPIVREPQARSAEPVPFAKCGSCGVGPVAWVVSTDRAARIFQSLLALDTELCADVQGHMTGPSWARAMIRECQTCLEVVNLTNGKGQALSPAWRDKR